MSREKRRVPKQWRSRKTGVGRKVGGEGKREGPLCVNARPSVLDGRQGSAGRN